MKDRRNKKRRTKSRVDYISNMPDEVLCHILSLLPTKTVVTTRLLSKRWQKLWTQVPAIDFTDEMRLCLTDDQIISCKDFVSKVLCGNAVPCCCSFSYAGDDYVHIFSCLSALSWREICEVTMAFDREIYCYVPDWFVSSKTLVVLKLQGCEIGDCTTTFCLPNLQVIHFVKVRLPDDGFMKRLSSNSPVLREIFVDNCCVHEDTLYIESLSLKSLEIRRCTFESDPHHGFETFASLISIRAPNLRYFCLLNAETQYDLGDLSLVIEANIDLDICAGLADDAYDDMANHTFQLITKISGVTTLRLGDFDVSYRVAELPVFQNLTCLTLKADDYSLELIKHAPMLRKLIFEEVQFLHGSFLSEEVPQFVNLESVELMFLKNDAIHLVGFLLKAATRLLEMNIKVMPLSRNQERDFYDTLLNLPKASAVCEFKIDHLGDQ